MRILHCLRVFIWGQNPLPRMDSGRLIVAALEQHRARFPEHWKAEVFGMIADFREAEKARGRNG